MIVEWFLCRKGFCLVVSWNWLLLKTRAVRNGLVYLDAEEKSTGSWLKGFWPFRTSL